MLMSPVDQSVFRSPVTKLASHSSSLNHHIYLRLRLALSLNLRRQIFIAVCDDVGLRNQFAAHLQSDLSSPALSADISFTVAPNRHGAISAKHTTEHNTKHNTNGAATQDSASSDANRPDANRPADTTPRLIPLALELENPDVLGQMGLWLSQNSIPDVDRSRILGFQITGVEHLTRQPAHIQRAFLDSLQGIATQRFQGELALQSSLNFNLVLWVTRPWCRSIQQSAPDFWHWHTALFEFEGDPTPEREFDGVCAIVPDRDLSATLPRQSLIDSEFRALVLATLKQDGELQSGLASANEHSAIDLLNDPSLQPVRLLQQIEKLHRDRASSDLVGTAYRELGDWYRDCAQQPQAAPSTYSVAIRAYEQSLRFIPSKSAQVSDILNDIGNLYWMMARASAQPMVNLEKALKAYQFALERTDAETQPEICAMLLNNLGSVYSDLSYRDAPVENLQQAIAAYQSCLQYRVAEEDPSRYAATQNNLGTAFWNLAQHQQTAVNLQQAIAAYNEALRYYDPEREPLHYAMLQNNLGTAYWTLSQCDEAMEALGTLAEDFLLLAIGAYRVALVYRTLEAAPVAFAATQNNLGTAYWHLANQPTTHYEDRQNYLHCAIAAYQDSLSAVQYLSNAGTSPAPALSFDASATHYNLGAACYQTAIDDRAPLSSSDRSSYLETALQHHVQALHGWQNNPDFYSNALSAIVQTVRTFHDRFGIQGQTLALSRVPANLLPSIMKEL
ncbi:MAG: tetratricopeptide repeat protein [Myxacorys californica WJT36-NPBG1]|jgi:tetratricopeptide (TPR) repeat protein|nr:tetratricopeptide repeat protein [Myxacorys californica WJT36-NPBG1]